MKNNFLKKRCLSFYYAGKGIKYLFTTQANAWIHASLTFAVLILGLFFRIATWEWCVLLLTIAMVLAAEAFNTALETIVDLVSPEYHRLAEIAKDTASGAVLITAFFAALVGLIVFLPKLKHFLSLSMF